METEILSYLPADHPWRDRFQYFDIIDSTNNRAKQMAAQGAPHGTVLVADQQLQGRGRMGRSFLSPPGCGIYLSVILRPDCSAEQLMHLTCASAVAVCDAAQAVLDFRPRIKWTNDIVWQGKKLSGILTELSISATGLVDYAVVGIGINCCQTLDDFPPDIRQIATSMALASGKGVDRSKLTAALIVALSHISDKLLTGRREIMDTYRKDCITTGQRISVVRGDSVRHGLALSVDDLGALLVAFDEGTTEAVNAGEVSIRGMYGYV